MQSSPIIITDAGKKYGKKEVLRNVDLSLKEGEIFGLIGLNGAGKTTLIKILLDLVQPSAGEASLFGMPAGSIQARQNIAYLPEKFQPSRYLKGVEYLDLSLAYYKQKLDIKKARELAEALDLDPDVLGARVGSYSKGMGQKLGLVGAFLQGSALLILDEPMSGLDPRARIKLKQQLLGAKKHGQTVFFSSHILSDIDEICDRIGVIHDGEMQFVGSPQDFKAQYNQTLLEQAFLHAIGDGAGHKKDAVPAP